jgi:branched-chain amino acid transport system ATP-binding protein
MLTVSALASSHGPVRALRGVTLAVGSGAFVALLGGNGAGKTTLLRAIAGLHRPVHGVIQFRGADLVRREPAAIVRRGVALAWEAAAFGGLSVAETLALGAMAGRGRHAAMLARVYALFPPLAAARSAPAAGLDGDAARMLAVGRAMVTRPRVLLLDEPMAGLSEPAAELMRDALLALHTAGVALLLAAQDAALALALCDYGYVLRRGGIVAQGKPAMLRESQAAREAFLG